MSREIYVAANWKLHKDFQETEAYFRDFADLVDGSVKTLFFTSPVLLKVAVESSRTISNLEIGAQNISENKSGAFTGETSVSQVKAAGAKWTLIGHSERRQLFGETNEVTALKMQTALEAGLRPLLCIGETLDERESGRTQAVVLKQLEVALAKGASKDLVVAYEPVWAIGTGKTATAAMASETHQIIRQALDSKHSLNAVPILYGGSVKGSNAAELMRADYIDGVLVGGASLKAEEFAQIANAARDRRLDTETR